MEQVIKRAIEGGYNVGPIEVDLICDNKYDHHWLSPLFWQALGKAEGWKILNCDCGGMHEGDCPPPYEEWKSKWHRFIDHLADGGTPDEFFEKLLTKQN